MLQWLMVDGTETDPDLLLPKLCTYCEWYAKSGNRKYVVFGGDDMWGVCLTVDAREILSHEWWPTGHKACGDGDIRTLSDAQRIAQDWETAIAAYEVWNTGLWETKRA